MHRTLTRAKSISFSEGFVLVGILRRYWKGCSGDCACTVFLLLVEYAAMPDLVDGNVFSASMVDLAEEDAMRS